MLCKIFSKIHIEILNKMLSKTSVFFLLRENRPAFREYFWSCFCQKPKVCVKKFKKVHVKAQNSSEDFEKNSYVKLWFLVVKKTKIACVKTNKWPWEIWGKLLNVPFFANVFQFCDIFFRYKLVFILLIWNSVRENINVCVKKLIFVLVKTNW